MRDTSKKGRLLNTQRLGLSLGAGVCLNLAAAWLLAFAYSTMFTIDLSRGEHVYASHRDGTWDAFIDTAAGAVRVTVRWTRESSAERPILYRGSPDRIPRSAAGYESLPGRDKNWSYTMRDRMMTTDAFGWPFVSLTRMAEEQLILDLAPPFLGWGIELPLNARWRNSERAR